MSHISFRVMSERHFVNHSVYSSASCAGCHFVSRCALLVHSVCSSVSYAALRFVSSYERTLFVNHSVWRAALVSPFPFALRAAARYAALHFGSPYFHLFCGDLGVSSCPTFRFGL